VNFVSEKETASEPSVVSAFGRAVEAGQRLLVNRMDLIRLDILDLIARTQRGAVLIIFGAVVTMAGWLAISVAAVLVMERSLPLPLSAALAGVGNAVLGAALVAAGIQRTRGAGREHDSASNGRPRG
jgi:hypothetical protein